MKVKIDLKMEVDLPDGTKRLHISDLWGTAQEFAEAACDRATSGSSTSDSRTHYSNNPFGIFLSEMLDRATDAPQKSQNGNVDPEQRPKPG